MRRRQGKVVGSQGASRECWGEVCSITEFCSFFTDLKEKSICVTECVRELCVKEKE